MNTNKSSFKITNMEEVKSALKSIPDAQSKSVVKSMLREVLKETLLKELKSNNPYEKYNKSIKIGSVKGDKGASMGISFNTDAYPLRFIEYGTEKREIKGRGKYPKGTNRGKMTKKPWIERVYKDNVQKVIEKYVDEGSEKIYKIIARKMRSKVRSINRKLKKISV